MTPQQTFAQNMWERAEAKFVKAERALGATWTEAYINAWRQADEVYDLAMTPDRPLITLGLRSITT